MTITDLILQFLTGAVLLITIVGLVLILKSPLNLDKVAFATLLVYGFFFSLFGLFSREQLPDASYSHMSTIVFIHIAYRTSRNRDEVFSVFKQLGNALWHRIPISKKATKS